MESHHRLEAGTRGPGPAPAHRPRLLAALGPCLLLSGLLLGCAPQSPAEPLPQPEPPMEDGKGWKPVTG